MNRFVQILDKPYKWLVAQLGRVGRDKLYHVIAGMIIAAFFIIVLNFSFAIFPVLVAAVLKEAFDNARGGVADIWDIIATLVGGGFINLLIFL